MSKLPEMSITSNFLSPTTIINENTDNEKPIIWPEMTDLEKDIIREWGTDINSMNLHNLITILLQKIKQTEGASFCDKLLNMNFTKPNGSLFENIMVQILTVSYCRIIDNKDGITTQTTPKLIELWGKFKNYYFQI